MTLPADSGSKASISKEAVALPPSATAPTLPEAVLYVGDWSILIWFSNVDAILFEPITLTS